MSQIKALVKESFAYGFANIVSRFIGFLLMPLYTNILTPDDYGILNVVNITIMLVTLFAVLGLDGAVHVFFWDSEDTEKKKRIFSSWYWSQLVFSIVLAAIMIFFSDTMAEGLFKSTEHADKFRLSALILLTGILPSIVINWFRVRRMPWPTTWYSLIMSLITIGLNVWFIAGLRWGIKGFFLAQIISGSIMSLVAIYIMKDWLSPLRVSRSLLRQMLKYSLPMIPTPLAFWSLNFAGSYFLQVIKGETEVGLFQKGSTIASIMMLVISSFTQAWGPFAMSIKENKDSNNLYAKVLILYSSVAGIFAVIIGVFAYEILVIMTAPAYRTAHFVTSILAFNTVITGLNFIAALGLNFVKNMKPYSFAIIMGAVFNLCLYSLVIKQFGKEGCALITLLSNIVVSAWIFRAAQKAYFIPYDFKKSVLIFFICVLAVIVGKSISTENFWTSVFIKMGIVLIVSGLLFTLNKNAYSNVFSKIGIINRN